MRLNELLNEFNLSYITEGDYGYNTNTVVEDVRKKRKEGNVFDLTNGKKIMSVIYLNSGEVIITNIGIATINQRMTENTEKRK